MKIKSTFFIALFSLAGFFSAHAQVKIGYTDMEYILALMPQTKAMDTELQAYQQKLMESLKISEDYAMAKLKEYQDLKSANRLSPEDEQKRTTELKTLESELNDKQQNAQYDLEAKKTLLLEPILKVLDVAVKAVAAERGMTYVLNQTTSAGVSTILYGPEENNITTDVLKKLNITPPQE